ncbi:MAG: phage holin family protein [Xanthomonadaceae bacterium]|jgi:hypothetical protein|nr:phage holin family protein [Xanthomonadaceae bacterium]
MDEDPRAADAGGKPQDAGEGATPSLEESLRQFGAAGRESMGAAIDTGRALRRLVAADFGLARVAIGRSLGWLSVAIIFGASSWLLLVGVMIALLQSFGVSWLWSISITAVISIGVTAFAGWRTFHYLKYTRMDATRRQLARWGIGDDDGDEEAS